MDLTGYSILELKELRRELLDDQIRSGIGGIIFPLLSVATTFLPNFHWAVPICTWALTVGSVWSFMGYSNTKMDFDLSLSVQQRTALKRK